jgi:hypothetical protein
MSHKKTQNWELYNEKIVSHSSGNGWRISEDDVGECVIWSFENGPSGRTYTERLRFYIDDGPFLGRAILEKCEEMEKAREADRLREGYDVTQENCV